MQRKQAPHKRPARRAAFTLIEVLLVLVILGVLAMLVVPNLLGTQEGANIKATKSSIKNLENTIKLYMQNKETTTFPQDLQVLLATQDEEGTPQKPILERYPTDAWGNRLNYEPPQQGDMTAIKPKIWSNGPNGTNEQGSGDDISNEIKPEEKQ